MFTLKGRKRSMSEKKSTTTRNGFSILFNMQNSYRDTCENVYRMRYGMNSKRSRRKTCFGHKLVQPQYE